jgi:hypothetical protein
MKKFSVFVLGTLLITGAAFGQAADNPFIMQGDRAELMHVMPTPERAGIDPSARGAKLDAPPTGFAVYRASYGAGSLIDHGGPVMSNAGAFNVFMGNATATAFQTALNGFVQAYTNRPDYNVITQYSKTGNAISGSLTFRGSYVDTTYYTAFTGDNTLSDTEVKSYVANLVTGPLAATLNGIQTSTIINLYFPQGLISTMGTSTGCGGSNVGYCGYHSWANVNGMHVKYAVYPYNNCSGCTISGKGVVDVQTIVTSHEIREAVTDPSDNGNAWYDRAGYEADDKCAWHNLYQMSGYWVQPEYSNRDKGCVVP